jgi:N-acetylmuramoyl-L-alanine amidase
VLARVSLAVASLLLGACLAPGSARAGAAPLVCLDPGHGGDVSRTEPVGPGSRVRKPRDSGGTAGEAPVVLAIARKARTLLLRRDLRAAMTRTGPSFTVGGRGNIDRARFCNRRGAALMLRIHADGSSDRARRGISTLYPAWRRGWTDDVLPASRRAATLVHGALIRATGAPDRGLVSRGDLTGFNWANVPVVLAETGFLTNAAERRRLTASAYQWRVARGLANGAERFVRPR